MNGALPQIALERDGSNSVLRGYTYGQRRVSQTAGSNTSYFLYDGLGSVANLVSSTGSTQWTWSYEPFGPTRTEQKANGNQPDVSMRFAGEYLDPTGLYHLRARQYDPASGRFLGRDPIPGPPADPYVSAYVYADNAPTVLLDPSGEFPCPRSICDPLKQLARGISRQRGKAAAAGFAFVGSAALYVAGGVATAGCLGAAEADPLLVIHCYGIAVFFGSGGIALAVSGGILIGDVYRAGAASRRRETVVGTPLQDLQDDNLGHNGR